MSILECGLLDKLPLTEMFLCLQKTAGSFVSFEPTKSIALHQVSDRICRVLATECYCGDSARWFLSLLDVFVVSTGLRLYWLCLEKQSPDITKYVEIIKLLCQ